MDFFVKIYGNVLMWKFGILIKIKHYNANFIVWKVEICSITLYNHSVPHHHHHHTTRNFLSTLELTYTQVWYIIGIVSSSPTDFHSEKIGLIRVTYDPLSVLGLINILCDLYSSVIHHWNCLLNPYSFPLRKNRVI